MYCSSNNLDTVVVDSVDGGGGGLKSITFVVKGEYAYGKLRSEMGVHRLVRISPFDASKRRHTTFASVEVAPEIVSESDILINSEDLKIDTYRSSGAGGQHVNTTDSAVRVTHIPSGLAVACQEGKSQHENKDKAIKLLQARLYDRLLQEKLEKEGSMRKSLVGRGDRSEKIRTYNYPQNRITDHRINFTIQRLDYVIEGKLDIVIENLINEDQKRKLSGEEEF
jgi:peptide chain release factor 1